MMIELRRQSENIFVYNSINNIASDIIVYDKKNALEEEKNGINEIS